MLRNNFIVGNNKQNFAILCYLLPNILEGTAVLVMACDEVVVAGNIVADNNSASSVFTDFSLACNAAADLNSEPNPNRQKILINVMRNNGNDSAAVVKAVHAAIHETTRPD